MAIYRNIQMSFWTDTKVLDDFSVNDKFLYLYLLTNPHTNLCGCYEISFRQIAYETGLETAKVKSAIDNLENVHKVISYCKDTKEVCILHWSRYNWTSSEKFRKPLLTEIEHIKNSDFKAFLHDLAYGSDDVLIPYQYGSDTTDTVTVTDTVPIKEGLTVKEINEFFEKAWKLYPRKRGKGQVSDKDKRKLAEIGLDHFTRALDRYKAYVEDSSFLQYQNGSTFFHSGYIDFLDENYAPSGDRKTDKGKSAEVDLTEKMPMYQEFDDKPVQKGEKSPFKGSLAAEFLKRKQEGKLGT